MKVASKSTGSALYDRTQSRQMQAFITRWEGTSSINPPGTLSELHQQAGSPAMHPLGLEQKGQIFSSLVIIAGQR